MIPKWRAPGLELYHTTRSRIKVFVILYREPGCILFPETSFLLKLNHASLLFHLDSCPYVTNHRESIVIFFQGSTYPYAGAQGQRYTDPYGRPTYPPSSAYPYYQSPPPQSMAQPPSRQQPVSSAVVSGTSCASSASPTQTHPMDFNSSNSGPPRPSPSQTTITGVHPIERPPSGAMNSNVPHSHTHPSPVHGSQMSSPLHASVSNTTSVSGSTSQGSSWPSHTPQPPFGSPHQLTHGQMASAIQSNNASGTVSGSRPRSASRDSMMKGNVIDGSNELTTMHGTPQPSESDRDNQMVTGVDEPGSRPQSRMSDVSDTLFCRHLNAVSDSSRLRSGIFLYISLSGFALYCQTLHYLG